MEAFKSYILALAVISITAGMVGILCPDGQKGEMKRWVRFLVGLAVACVLLVPLKPLTKGLADWFTSFTEEKPAEDSGGDAAEAFVASYLDRVLTEAHRGVCRAHGLADEQVSITAVTDASDLRNVRISSAVASLTDVDSMTAGVIREELEKMFGCDVTIERRDGTE